MDAQAILGVDGVQQAIIPAARLDGRVTVDQMIAAWLDDKAGKSQSKRTPEVYAATLASYRAFIRTVGLDLDCLRTADEAQRETLLMTLATLLQAWAGQRRDDGRDVAASTFNLRRSAVSSFYAFARKRRMLVVENPASLLDKHRTQEYAGARPLPADDVERRMATIDRATLAGLRDYALLAIALSTGRRLSEIADLRWEHVKVNGRSVTLGFLHAKGGKVMWDALAAPVADALHAWLAAYYGERLATLPGDAPIWLALSHNTKRERPMTIDAISDVCRKWLGVSKFHSTRHTFAHEMEALGAKVSDIQARLGHASLETTSRYLTSLRQAQNPYSDALAARLGLTTQVRPRRNSGPTKHDA